MIPTRQYELTAFDRPEPPADELEETDVDTPKVSKLGAKPFKAKSRKSPKVRIQQ